MNRYTPRQLRLLAALFAAYTAAYISRANLAPALAAIQADFSLSAAQAGLMPTLFSIPYALGQIVTGAMADKFRPRGLIVLGLCMSGAVNVAFSLAAGYGALLALWCLNGAFQSMIWTPMVRILAVEYGEEVRPRAMFALSMTLIAGFLIAWAMSGFLAARVSWRWAMRSSGLVTLSIGVLCRFAIRDTLCAAQPRSDQSGGISALKLILGTDLGLLLLASVFNGYVRDGIMNWAPQVIAGVQGFDMNSTLAVTLVIPMINLAGILAGKALWRRQGERTRLTCAWLQGGSAVLSLVLAMVYDVHPLVCTLLLGLCSAASYGSNPLITSFLPMDYQRWRRVGLAAGLLDAMIYAGSALSGAVAGAICDAWGWRAVFMTWAAGSAVGTALFMLSRRGEGQ